MLSGSGHLACRVVDAIVSGLLVLNLGSNLVLVLGLGFRLYSKQNTRGTKSTRCNAQTTGCMADALRKH